MEPASGDQSDDCIQFAGLYEMGVSSMEPTITADETVLISQYLDEPCHHLPPTRGDIVAYRVPSDPSTYSISRVIGLPGDSVQMIGGHLYINGEPAFRAYVSEYLFRGTAYLRYAEVLPNGRRFLVLERSDTGSFDNTPVFRVPLNHFFVMGDNRDASLDSRVPGRNGEPPHTGYVRFDHLIGRAEAAWSFDLGPDSFREMR